MKVNRELSRGTSARISGYRGNRQVFARARARAGRPFAYPAVMGARGRKDGEMGSGGNDSRNLAACPLACDSLVRFTRMPRGTVPRRPPCGCGGRYGN